MNVIRDKQKDEDVKIIKRVKVQGKTLKIARGKKTGTIYIIAPNGARYKVLNKNELEKALK